MQPIGFADLPPDIFRVIIGDPVVGLIEHTVLRETSRIFATFIPRHPIRKKWICAEAARVGNTPIVRWGQSIGCPLNSAAHASAVHGGHHDTVRWIDSQNWSYDDSACKFMAFTSGLNGVRWVLSHAYPRYQKLPILAAEIGALDMLAYAMTLKYTWDDRICVIAARHGHLNILKYAYGGGECMLGYDAFTKARKRDSYNTNLLNMSNYKCAHADNVCTEAAASGHLEVVKWAYLHGFCINKHAYIAAFAAGHLDVVQWLHTVVPINNPSLLMPAAVRGGNAAAVKWLEELVANMVV